MTHEDAFSSHQDQLTHQTLAKRAAELEVVAQVSMAMVTVRNSIDLLQTVVNLTQERFQLNVVNACLLAEDGRTLYLAASAGDIGQQFVLEKPVITIDQTPSLVARAARERQSVVINNVHEERDYLAHPLLAAIQSELVVPIIVADRLLGVLDVQSHELNRFGPDEVRIFTIMALQLGIALENAWRFEEIEKFSAELEESRQFLDSIIENMPTPLFVKDAKDLRMVRTNKANELLLGMKAETLIGKTDYDLFPQEEADFFTAKDREILATGQPVESPEHPIHTAEGDVRLIHTRKVPIVDSEGKPKFVLGIAEDITERKRLEHEIQASWERRGRQVQIATEVAQEIAAAPALDELFWRVVDRVQSRFGYYYVQVYMLEKEEVVLQAGSGDVGRRLKAAGHKIPYASDLSLIAQAAQTGEPVLVPNVAQEPRWLPNALLPKTKAELAVPITLRHEILGVLDVQHHTLHGLTTEDQLLLTGLCGQIAIAIDYRRVEARRLQVEDQLKASLVELEINNRELQEFAFIASHDLQEPLRKIQAFSDRLQSMYGDDIDERGQDYLKRLQQAAVRMQMLIADYLAFSRVSAMTQSFAELDLAEVVETVLLGFEAQISESQAHVVVTDMPVVEAEMSQMYLLFRHLISNALKFRRDDITPHIYISSQYVGEAAAHSQITVTDNGLGFDEQYSDRIFRAFQKLHGRTQYEGTGMGLAICRKVVERHHGFIKVASTPGQGSAFTVTLPVRQPTMKPGNSDQG